MQRGGSPSYCLVFRTCSAGLSLSLKALDLATGQVSGIYCNLGQHLSILRGLFTLGKQCFHSPLGLHSSRKIYFCPIKITKKKKKKENLAAPQHKKPPETHNQMWEHVIQEHGTRKGTAHQEESHTSGSQHLRWALIASMWSSVKGTHCWVMHISSIRILGSQDLSSPNQKKITDLLHRVKGHLCPRHFGNGIYEQAMSVGATSRHYTKSLVLQ